MRSQAHLSFNVGNPLTLTTAAEINKEADAFYKTYSCMTQADCENMLLQAPRDSAGSWGQKKVQNPASLVKGSDS